MRRVALVIPLLIACDAGERSPAERSPAGPRPDEVASAEIHAAHFAAQRQLDSVARSVLEGFLVDRTTVPDSGLLQGDHFYIDRALGYDDTSASLTNAALPLGHFELRAVADMQAEADRTHETVSYIFIHDLHIEADRATFWVGVHVKIPDVPEGSGTCCCSAELVYVKRSGMWVYSETTTELCS